MMNPLLINLAFLHRLPLNTISITRSTITLKSGQENSNYLKTALNNNVNNDLYTSEFLFNPRNHLKINREADKPSYLSFKELFQPNKEHSNGTLSLYNTIYKPGVSDDSFVIEPKFDLLH